MKASRAMARQANSLKSAEERLTAIEETLTRIEDLLVELHAHGMVSKEELDDVLNDPEPTTKEVHAEAFAEARKPRRKPKGAANAGPETK